MLDPIHLENDQVIVHAFRPEEMERYDTLVKEVYQLFTDAETLRFIPEKRMASVQEADGWLKSNILNYHCDRNFLHFVSDKRSGKLLGLIDLFTPDTIREYYRLPKYTHFIEFYLCGKARGKKLMTKLLPQLLEELNLRGIREIGAAINTKNAAARKVLLYAGFTFERSFDTRQEFYQFNTEAHWRQVS